MSDDLVKSVKSIDKEFDAAYAKKGDRVVPLSDGTNIEVLECRVKHIGPIVRLIREAFDILEVKKMDDFKEIKLGDPEVFLKLIAEGSDSLFKVGAVLCSMSLDDFEELPIDDAMAILLKEFEVNKDFFMDRVIPLVTKQFGSPAPAVKSKGK